ncbi:zinc finger protein 729-like [Ptychodera flava]|uniref:zinc finger protein 729-like n=1 Tax=Ptychodera flava TaxID=63121 RepID=UPI00396AAF1A
MAERALQVVRELDKMRSRAELCDLNIFVGPAKFSVHKVVMSAYSKILKDQLLSFQREKISTVVLQNISVETFEVVLRFAYCSDSKDLISLENAQGLMSASKLLHMQALQDACIAFLAQNLTVSNFLRITKIASTVKCEQFSKTLKDFMLENLISISSEQAFLELEIEEFIKYMCDEKLLAAIPNELANATEKWVCHNEERRRPLLNTISELSMQARVKEIKREFLDVDHWTGTGRDYSKMATGEILFEMTCDDDQGNPSSQMGQKTKFRQKLVSVQPAGENNVNLASEKSAYETTGGSSEDRIESVYPESISEIPAQNLVKTTTASSATDRLLEIISQFTDDQSKPSEKKTRVPRGDTSACTTRNPPIKRRKNRHYPRMCPVCGIEYSRVDELDGHMQRIHDIAKQRKPEDGESKDLVYKCTLRYCRMRFASVTELKQHHASAHHGKWKFKCKICSKGFWKQFHLDCHMKGHTQNASDVLNDSSNEKLSDANANQTLSSEINEETAAVITSSDLTESDQGMSIYEEPSRKRNATGNVDETEMETTEVSVIDTSDGMFADCDTVADQQACVRTYEKSDPTDGESEDEYDAADVDTSEAENDESPTKLEPAVEAEPESQIGMSEFVSSNIPLEMEKGNAPCKVRTECPESISGTQQQILDKPVSVAVSPSNVPEILNACETEHTGGESQSPERKLTQSSARSGVKKKKHCVMHYKCGICGMVCKRINSLDNHMLRIHFISKQQKMGDHGDGGRLYKCFFRPCKARFSSTAELRKHLASVHHKKWKLKCHICGRAFFKQFNLDCHMKGHAENVNDIGNDSRNGALLDANTDETLKSNIVESSDEKAAVEVESADPTDGEPSINVEEEASHHSYAIGNVNGIDRESTMISQTNASDGTFCYFDTVADKLIRVKPTRKNNRSEDDTAVVTLGKSEADKKVWRQKLKQAIKLLDVVSENEIESEQGTCDGMVGREGRNAAGKANNKKGVSLFRCKLCKKTYSVKQSAKLHIMVSHFKIKHHICSFCNAAFSKRDALVDHAWNIHHKNIVSQRYRTAEGKSSGGSTGKWPCSKCPERFSSYRKLKQHGKIHNYHLWRHKCTVCGKRFSKITLLMIHLKGCRGMDVAGDTEIPAFQDTPVAKPKQKEPRQGAHKCHECGKTYGQIHFLVKHIRVVHKGMKAHECDHCHLQFSDRLALIGHIHQVHAESSTLQCGECKLEFNDTQSFETHRQFHCWRQCYVCSESFSDKMQFLVHQEQTHHQQAPTDQVDGKGVNEFTKDAGPPLRKEAEIKKPEKSESTGKETEPQKHYVTHQEEVFNCYTCDLSFASREHLTAHVKQEHEFVLLQTAGGEEEKQSQNERTSANTYSDANDTNVEETNNERGKVEEASVPGLVFTDQDTNCGSEKHSIKLDKFKPYRKEDEKDRPFKCNKCPISFSQQRYLNYHYKTHSGKEVYTCDKCGRMFRRSTHKHTCFYKCNKCEKVFNHPFSFNQHKFEHMDRRFYQCEICGTFSTSKSSLQVHLYIHLGIKPHKCRFCDKTFVQHSSRMMHERTHTGEKPNLCELCGKRFLSPHELRIHKKRNHPDASDVPQTSFKCKICGKVFSSAYGLCGHSGSHMSGTPLPCTICGKTFVRKKSLYKHVEAHKRESDVTTTNN